jgi:hypothetical protein
MISSEEFGERFVTNASNRAIEYALRRVTGAAVEPRVRENYERLYNNKHDNIEVFRKVATIAADCACLKLLELIDSGRYRHFPIERNPNFSNEMFKDGGWIDRFSIFGR